MSKTPSLFSFITDKSLSNNLDVNKAHGDNVTSICVLKLCDKSIRKLFHIIFKSSLTQGIFPSE